MQQVSQDQGDNRDTIESVSNLGPIIGGICI